MLQQQAYVVLEYYHFVKRRIQDANCQGTAARSLPIRLPSLIILVVIIPSASEMMQGSHLKQPITTPTVLSFRACRLPNALPALDLQRYLGIQRRNLPISLRALSGAN